MDISTDKIQNVIAKIQALRNLSKSTHSRAEAEMTLSIASKLMEQHKLTELEVQIQNDSVEGIELEQEYIIYEAGRVSEWRQSLAFSLASLNGLFAFESKIRHSITHKQGSRIRVIGKLSNIQIALYQFEYLSSTIKELADREYPGNFVVNAEGKLVGKRGLNPEKESWCSGCVSGFVAKMKAEQVEVLKAATSTALAIVSNEAAEAKKAYLQKTGVRMGVCAPSKAQRDASAYSSGYTKGQTFSTRKGIL